MKKNEIYSVDIDAWSSEGDGICRVDGLAVFVRGGVPGDKCDIRIVKVRKSYAYAIIEKTHSPSPNRIESSCSIGGKCGGCAMSQVRYEEELRMKHARVADALKRIGGIDLPVDDILPSTSISGYRNKVIFQTDQVNGEPVIGFYRRGSHDVLAVDSCMLQSDSADKAAAVVLDFAKEHGVRMYDERRGEGTIRYIYYRSSSIGTAQICIVSFQKTFNDIDVLVGKLRAECPELTGIMLCHNPHKGNVAMTDDLRVLWGDMYLTDTLCGLTFRISPLSFYQINHAQTENLYRFALEFANLSSDETVLDLYCGIGTITLVMARHAGKAIGAEIVPQAVEDAKANAALNAKKQWDVKQGDGSSALRQGLSDRRSNQKNNSADYDYESFSFDAAASTRTVPTLNVIAPTEFICADAAEAAEKLIARGERIEVVTVDPPRKGLGRDAIDAIIRISPERIVYVSCDPATLARDLKVFCENGYDVTRVKPVDMFPRTNSIECVALLTRHKKQR